MFIDTEDELSSPETGNEDEVDRFKHMAMIGTDLHIIESMSNEVSHSTESHQNESLHQIIQKQAEPDSNFEKQDNMLKELQNKNN